MPPLPSPPSPAWRRALLDAARLRTEDASARHAPLVAAVRGREGRAAFATLIASVRAAHDHGVYEGTHNALWRFPADDLGAWLAAALLPFQRRMGRHDQVARFYGPIPSRRRVRAAFVRGVRALPAAEMRRVIALLRRWSVEHDAWEPVLAELGAAVPAAPPAGAAPATWPPAWRRFHAQVAAGTRDLIDAWGATGKPTALPLVVALLTVELGARWRDADSLTNPVFMSFAKAHYPTFVALVRALPAADRTRLLANLGRAAPRKRRQLVADLARR